MRSSKFSPLRIIAGSLIILGAVACNSTPKNDNDNAKDSIGMGKIPPTHSQDMADRKADSTFMVKANGINQEEIKLGNLAKDKSNTEAVVQLADILVTDHTKLNQNLSDLANDKSMSLSSSLSDDAQDAYDDLNDLSGSDFDKEYVNKMVKGHANAIALFEKDSSGINDSDIRQYAIKTLPILRKHLAKAKNSQAELKSTK